MSTTATLYMLIFAAWLVYAGYLLWRGTVSHTAKWFFMVLVVSMGIGLAQDWINWGKPSASQQAGAAVGIDLGGDNMFCVGCKVGNQNGNYLYRANWIAGKLELKPIGTQPYALSYKSGTVKLGGQTLPVGCSSGELSGNPDLELAGVRGLRLEVGPGAGCK